MNPSIRYKQKRLTPSGEKRFYWKHVAFAERAVTECVKHGLTVMGYRLPPFVHAYLRTYPKARSRAGARASMSKLLRRSDVRAAIQWFYAVQSGEIPRQIMPDTPSGVRAIFEQSGNWRARIVAPTVQIVVRYEE